MEENVKAQMASLGIVDEIEKDEHQSIWLSQTSGHQREINLKRF